MVAPAPKVEFPPDPEGRKTRRKKGRKKGRGRKDKRPSPSTPATARRPRLYIALGVFLAFYAIAAVILGGFWPWFGMVLLGGLGVAAIILGAVDLLEEDRSDSKARKKGKR